MDVKEVRLTFTGSSLQARIGRYKVLSSLIDVLSAVLLENGRYVVLNFKDMSAES